MSIGNRFSGVVVASHRDHALIADDNQQTLACATRRGQQRLVVGDEVVCESTANDTGRIVAVLPRRSLLKRTTASGKQRLIAANIDRVLIVISTRPAYTPLLVDRFLLVAGYLCIPAELVLNKLDLIDDHSLARIETELDYYADIGYPSHKISALNGEGVDGLARRLRDKTAILVGQSGVGKSSLIKRLCPQASARTQSLSARTPLGRHTTSAATLFSIPDGGRIIDSPGVREFALWDIPETAVCEGFPEVKSLQDQCRFRDCRHHREPGCAVVAAVNTGKIRPERLHSYRELRNVVRGRTKLSLPNPLKS